MAQLAEKEEVLLTSKDVLDFLKISRYTLSRWIKEGKLKAYEIGVKRYFKRSEIMEYLEANQVKLN